MLNVTKTLNEGEVTMCCPFEGLGKEVLKGLCRANDLIVSDNKGGLLPHLIAAGVHQE